MNTVPRRRLPAPRRLWPALLGLFALQGLPTAFAGELEDAIAAVERGDYPQAIPVLDALAAAGDPVAATRLAALYQRGRGVAKDPVRAAQLYEQAAQRGNADAQFNLGNMYLLGEGVPQDDDWAFTYYRAAARQGHHMAQKNVREFYRAAGLTPPEDEVPTQEAPPLPVAPPQPVSADAAPNVVPAAQPGVAQPPANYTADELKAMQIAREHGIRIEQADVPPGAAAPADSAAAGVPVEPVPAAADRDLAEARALLASGAPANALPMLESQASAGHAEAQYLLAELLTTLNRQPADASDALRWLRRAAAGGHPDAQYALALRYERGEGVAVDDAEAVTWFRAAARQGHAGARERLRAIYREAGLPLPVDVETPGDGSSGSQAVPGRSPLADLARTPESNPCIQHASTPRAA